MTIEKEKALCLIQTKLEEITTLQMKIQGLYGEISFLEKFVKDEPEPEHKQEQEPEPENLKEESLPSFDSIQAFKEWFNKVLVSNKYKQETMRKYNQAINNLLQCRIIVPSELDPNQMIESFKQNYSLEDSKTERVRLRVKALILIFKHFDWDRSYWNQFLSDGNIKNIFERSTNPPAEMEFNTDTFKKVAEFILKPTPNLTGKQYKSYYAVKLWCHIIIGCFHLLNYADYIHLPIVEQATEQQKKEGCVCLSEKLIYFREGTRQKNKAVLKPSPISINMVKFLKEEYPHKKLFEDFQADAKHLSKVITGSKYLDDTDIGSKTIRTIRCNELNKLYGDGNLSTQEYEDRVRQFGHSINVHLQHYLRNVIKT